MYRWLSLHMYLTYVREIRCPSLEAKERHSFNDFRSFIRQIYLDENSLLRHTHIRLSVDVSRFKSGGQHQLLTDSEKTFAISNSSFEDTSQSVRTCM